MKRVGWNLFGGVATDIWGGLSQKSISHIVNRSASGGSYIVPPCTYQISDTGY